MLYPRESSPRNIKSLDGIWRFRAEQEGDDSSLWPEGLTDTIHMPVPASFNDITQDRGLRDHLGNVWYETTPIIPNAWRGRRVVLRVGSASHSAEVWVNGKSVMTHQGGFLPFECDITAQVQWGGENRVTVRVNNLLNWQTLPPGELQELGPEQRLPEGYRKLEIHHDFLNYGGIHRPVKLYTTPPCYIRDIHVRTDINGHTGIIKYRVILDGGEAPLCVTLFDANGKQVTTGAGSEGTLSVPHAELWRPGRGYLYTLRVESGGDDPDRYDLPVGIRTVEVTDSQFLINGEPFYFKGFGKHEDADLRGKGLDHVTNVKDFNLLRWINANSFRTSHYPYAEEIMQLADEYGIVVIDEVPAVGFNIWGGPEVFCEERVNDASADNHIRVLQELVMRDKNHPCVVMWSLVNEAATDNPNALTYFAKVVAAARAMDDRPLTAVQSSLPAVDTIAHLVDVICFNRYYGWYSNPGDTSVIEYQLSDEIEGWRHKHCKPVMVTEYGADTIDGFHADPPVMFSEEYQVEMLDLYHRVFDRYEYFIGEHVWNFADFMTKQAPKRVYGNRKGVFTRQRQPKAAAHLLRRRWRDKGVNRSA